MFAFSLYLNYAVAAKAATALANRFSVGLHKDTHTVTHTNIHAHILLMCKNRVLNTASI